MRYKTGDLSDYVSQSPETIRIQLENINDIIISIFVSFTYFCLYLISQISQFYS